MFAAAATDLLPGVIGWVLVTLIVGVAIVLYVGRRHEHGVLGRIRSVIAKPQQPMNGRPAEELALPSEAAGLRRRSSTGAAPSAQTQAPTPRVASPAPVGRPSEAASDRPAPLGGCVAEATLAPLAKRVDRSRRLVACEARVQAKLGELPRDRWVVDSYVLVGGHRVPFLVLGETGMFAIWPLDGTPHPTDPEHFDDAARVIENLLPGYPGRVQVGMCRTIDPGMQPRWWIAPPARVGAWVMGLDWLIAWIDHFGTEHGFGVSDAGRFDALAGPDWTRRVTGVPLPSRPASG